MQQLVREHRDDEVGCLVSVVLLSINQLATYKSKRKKNKFIQIIVSSKIISLTLLLHIKFYYVTSST